MPENGINILAANTGPPPRPLDVARHQTRRSMIGGIGGVKIRSTAAADTVEGKLEQLRELSADLESVFIGMMMKAMRDTIPENGLMGGGSAEKTFQSMADVETSRNVAKVGGFGIGKAIFQQMAQQFTGKSMSQLMAVDAYRKAMGLGGAA